MRFQLLIIINFFMLCATSTQLTSKCKGVSWNQKRNLWQVELHINGKKQKSYFHNKFDAAKKLNQVCETMEIPQQNPEICEIPNQQKNEKISQYKGVYWNRERGKWYVLMYLKGGKIKYGGQFNDELDAAKRVKQLYEELGMRTQKPTISTIPNQLHQKKERSSQYKGICWNKHFGKWCVLIFPKGQKQKYGGNFNDELDAAKRVNQLCEELGIPPQNPTISAIPNEQYQKQEKTSQYKGVTWYKQRKKWYVLMYLKGGKLKFGGHFKYELDAGKRVNQLCEELGISPLNPTISAIQNQQYRYQKKEKTSQYKGVSWHREMKKWRVQLSLVKGEKTKHEGYFSNELDAGKRVNQLCEKLGILPQNPKISAIPNEQYQVIQKSEKTSQYKGVTWHKQRKKWCAQLSIKGEEPKYGGIFMHELDAAKRVNQLCKEFGIPQQNPDVVEMPTQQSLHDDYKTIANAVISSDILKIDNDDPSNKKRKREKEFNDDNKLSYFYENLLK